MKVPKRLLYLPGNEEKFNLFSIPHLNKMLSWFHHLTLKKVCATWALFTRTAVKVLLLSSLVFHNDFGGFGNNFISITCVSEIILCRVKKDCRRSRGALQHFCSRVQTFEASLRLAEVREGRGPSHGRPTCGWVRLTKCLMSHFNHLLFFFPARSVEREGLTLIPRVWVCSSGADAGVRAHKDGL